jgi:hypothetical protein
MIAIVGRAPNPNQCRPSPVGAIFMGGRRADSEARPAANNGRDDSPLGDKRNGPLIFGADLGVFMSLATCASNEEEKSCNRVGAHERARRPAQRKQSVNSLPRRPGLARPANLPAAAKRRAQRARWRPFAAAV